ncbi:MAG: malto-oligosyltrehalose synthase [Actinomycetota bacterium]|nr:malto-oligosyltrehalose synthase [Actinomycetota bacterium]
MSPDPLLAAERPASRRATYRLQMRGEFGFGDAQSVVDYLAELGISHLYLSPILQAAQGSTHGYDVVDPTRVNAELGGSDGYARLCETVSAAGLRQLVDVVPNHMAITGRDNRWWWDVLENGPASIYASYFDVDWDPPESKLRNVVLLPILGDHYGRELEGGNLRLEREGGSFVLHYYDHVVPIAPRTLDAILEGAVARLGSVTATEEDLAPVAAELASVATAFGRLPRSTATDAASVAERHRDKEILRTRLGRLCQTNPEVGHAIDEAVSAINGDPDALDDLLDRQNFRLAWWRTAGEELDYRRFFDINDLAGIRVEDPAVFTDSHQLILNWLGQGVVDGIRIDHVDGLRDPGTYLARLQAAVPGTWVVVEKILEGPEVLPSGWAMAGTTGYGWLNVVAGVLNDADGSALMVEIYQGFSGITERYEEIVQHAKDEVLEGPLATDLNRLVSRLTVICERHRRYRDYTRRDLRVALAEVIAGFSVYRTYVRAGTPSTSSDVNTVERAVLGAGIRDPDIDEELLGLLRDLLLGRIPGRDELELTLRTQQLTGPVMAKAVEDTAFYRYVPVSWLNEVGGDPGRLGVSIEDFHQANQTAQDHAPEALLATSTHDTKRSEDVRARLSVLAEIPREWEAAVLRWRAHHRKRQSVAPPDGNTEWLAYQSFVGAWPLDGDRAVAYLAKATREAKVHTSWTDPDPFYDQQLEQWIRDALSDHEFTADLEAFVADIRRPGWAVALAQKLATLTAPGIPDLYQGSECWDFSLVDPDNRRPVDYEHRRRLLTRCAQMTAVAAWAEEEGSGLTKLAVTWGALQVRREHPEWFGPGVDGRYEALEASGPAARHVIAWCRGGGAITVVTRTATVLDGVGGWGDTTLSLPPGCFIDRLGGGNWEGNVLLGDVLAGLPVALLVAEGPRR